MKITKALKLKNRLSGELNRLRGNIQSLNSAKTERHEPEYVRDLIKRERETYAELISVKAGIQKATAPIAERLIRLSEAKAKLVWFERIPTKEGTFDDSDRYSSTAIEKTVTYDVVWGKDTMREYIESARKTIERLQDEIDEYNAKTEIEKVYVEM